MVTTGQDIVNEAYAVFAIPGIHYENTSERRCHPDVWPHEVDCSGLVCYILNKRGLAKGCVASADLARWCHAKGTSLRVDVALSRPGRLLFRGKREGQDGYGVDGHVAITKGDNVHVLEAAGHYAGVGERVALGRTWDYAADIPGVITAAGIPTPTRIPRGITEELEVLYLPGQDAGEFRPIGISAINGTLFVWNAKRNPFKEGALKPWPNAHVLELPLAPQEDILGITDRTPTGAQCPASAPVEVLTNLPGGGQARHVLHAA